MFQSYFIWNIGLWYSYLLFRSPWETEHQNFPTVWFKERFRCSFLIGWVLDTFGLDLKWTYIRIWILKLVDCVAWEVVAFKMTTTCQSYFWTEYCPWEYTSPRLNNVNKYKYNRQHFMKVIHKIPSIFERMASLEYRVGVKNRFQSVSFDVYLDMGLGFGLGCAFGLWAPLLLRLPNLFLYFCTSDEYECRLRSKTCKLCGKTCFSPIFH